MIKYEPLKKLNYGAIVTLILYVVMQCAYSHNEMLFIYDIFLMIMWLVTYILLVALKNRENPYKDVREIIYDNKNFLIILFSYKALMYIIYSILIFYNITFDYEYTYNFEIAFIPLLFLFPISQFWKIE